MNRLEEQQKILKLLCPGTGKGNIIKNNILNKRLVGYKASSVAENLVSDINSGNTFVTLNVFSGKRRTQEKLFAINGMFVDMDGHKLSKDDLEVAKQNTIKAIDKAIENKELCDCTAMFDSGRGIGMIFLYNRSIAVHGNTEKQIKFHKSIYKKMLLKIKEILDKFDGLTLTVDMNVMDGSRLMGLAGTYNYSSHTFRTIIKYNPDTRFSMSQIADICDFKHTPKVCSVSMSKKKEYNISAFATKRLNNLKSLQQKREDWAGYHHSLCFIVYNTLILLMDEMSAIDALEEFNRSFSDYGITKNEIRSIVSSTRKCKNFAFKMTNAYIINKLNLTADEAMLFVYESEQTREEAHKEVVNKKFNRDKIVVKEILACKTYGEVQLKTGVSLRTIKRIAKKYNCGHTNGSVKEFDKINWDEVYDTLLFKNQKSAKICYMDVNGNTNETDALSKDQKKNEEEGLFSMINFDIDIEEEKEEKFVVEGINFDITIENEEKETVTVDENKFEYGLSFLCHLREYLPKKQAHCIELFMEDLYNCKDSELLNDTYAGINFIASEYTYDPVLEAAFYDVMRVYKAFTNGHFAMNVHGIRRNLTDDMRNKEYPTEYIAMDGIDEIKQKLSKDLRVSCITEIQDAFDKTFYWFDKLMTTKGWKRCIIRNKEIRREDFIRALKKITVYDITSIVNTAAKNIKNKKYRNDFIGQREIFWNYCVWKFGI